MKRDPIERALPKRNTSKKITIQENAIIKGTSIINNDYHKRIKHYLKSIPVICRDGYP